jgi:hypothetical protein
MRSVLIVVLLLHLALTPEPPALRQPRPPVVVPAEIATITIAAKIGKKRYQATGDGTCRHAQDASIHGVSASLWTVQFTNRHESGLKQLNLTLWRPKDGSPDHLSLNLETKSGSHRIQSGQEGDNAGEGTVTILPSGPGGRLEITGKTADGKKLQLTVDCQAFSDGEGEAG